MRERGKEGRRLLSSSTGIYMFELLDYDNGSHPFLHKKEVVRIVAGATSGLSIVGSLLIILSYACFSVLRTKTREILVHISFMDLGAAACNLIGIIVNFDHLYGKCATSNTHTLDDDATDVGDYPHCPSISTKVACILQGSFATYFTLASIMWTISLAIYLYILICQNSSRKARLFVLFAYMFCYIMPAGIVGWLLGTKRISYSPYESTGWCSVLFKNPQTGSRDVFGALIGYDLWIYLTFLLVPLFAITVHLHIRQKLKVADSYERSTRDFKALQKLDYKFLFIPVAFIALRMWSFIGDTLFVFVGVEHVRPRLLARILMTLEGIGDSGQGAANAILFVLFTKKVRDKFMCCCSQRCYRMNGHSIQERARLMNAKINRNRSYSNSAEDHNTPTRGSPIY